MKHSGIIVGPSFKSVIGSNGRLVIEPAKKLNLTFRQRLAKKKKDKTPRLKRTR